MPLDIKELLTIIIPTYNRYERLERLLNYYKSYNFPAKKIYVLDSSDRGEVSDSLQSLLESENVDYLRYPSDIPSAVKISRGIENVSTLYTILCADDDFITPSGMKKCVDFLELHPDYNSAQGRITAFWIKDNSLHRIAPVQFYGRTIDTNADTPNGRIIQQFSLYQNHLYAVKRTKSLRIWSEVVKSTINEPLNPDSNIEILGSLREILETYVSVILGKHKVLPIFYCARESIEGSPSIYTEIETVIEKYPDDYSRFIESLASLLSTVQEIGRHEAKSQILAGMNAYLNVFRPGYNDGAGTGRFKHVPSPEEIKGEAGYPFFDNQEAINEWQRMEFFIKQSLLSNSKTEHATEISDLQDSKATIDAETKQPDILYAFYDLSVSTTGFDIISYLVLAELERKKIGCAFLHVIIVPGPDEGFRKNDLKAYQSVGAGHYDADSMRWRLRNILLPCCWLIPSCQQVTVCTSRQEAQALESSLVKHIFPRQYSVSSPKENYGWKHFNDTVSQNTIPPSIQATSQACRFVNDWIQINIGKRKLITITLRESSYEQGKNSNLTDWGSFARSLDSAVYCPVVIRDTETAFSPLPSELEGLLIFPEAVWNMELRAALYELSYLNMSVNNGPAHLCALNRKTCILIYKIIAPSLGASSAQYFRSCGIEPGSQLKTLTPFQRWVWEDDRLDVLQRTFKEMCDNIERFSTATLPDLLHTFQELLNKNDFNNAEWISSLAVDHFNDHHAAWMIRALILRLTNQPTEALSAIERSIRLNATPDSLSELIRIYQALGLHDKASQLSADIAKAQELKQPLALQF